MSDSGVTHLLAALVRIDSVNPSLVPDAAGEAAISVYVADWLSHAGLDVTLEEVAPGRANVVAVSRGFGGGRTLMLNAHMDTVGVAGFAGPFDPRIADGRLYGRGAADTKGGLAAAMWAAAEVSRRSRHAGDLVLTAVVDEEYASIGTEAVAAAHRADAAVVLEPTQLTLCPAHKGFVWATVVIHGRAAHGSLPDEGIDAIAKAGHFLVALEAIGARLGKNAGHAVVGHGSVHASLISGGQELSSYPAECTITVERRTVPGERGDTVESELQSVLDELAARDGDFRASLTIDFARDPLEVTSDEPILELVARHVTAVTGRDAEILPMAGWTDAAILNAAGIPAVVFGPVGAGYHGVDEWVDLASVPACADVLQRAAEEFCGE